MKKDIPFLPVEGVSVAISREKNEINEFIWSVWLLNRNNHFIKNVFIRSKGYGTKDGEQQLTSTLRYHIPALDAGASTLIEPIDPAVFHLYNEYWVSYFVENQVFDKKFIFVPESIVEDNIIYIPEIEMEGILHN